METPAPRSRSALRRWLARGSWGALLLAATIVALGAWLALAESGARYALERAMRSLGGEVTGVGGRLAGPLAIESLVLNAGKTQIRASRVTLDWSPGRLLERQVRIDRLHAASITVESEPSDGPAGEPDTLALPFVLHVAQASADRVVIATRGKPDPLELRDLSLKFAGDGTAWVVRDGEAQTPFGRASVNGTLGAVRPFVLDAKGALEGLRGERKYRLTLAAKGPLSDLEASFAGAEGGEGGLEGGGRARLALFEAMPLRALSAKLSGLDAAAFGAAVTTKLALEAELAPAGDLLLAGPVKLANASPGPLDKGRLPVVSAAGRLALAKDGGVKVQGVDVALAGGGRASGDYAYANGRLDAVLVVKGLDLLAWHSSLRATSLAGSLRAEATQGAQSFTLDLADPRFTVAGAARIAKGVLEVERVRLARTESALEASGRIELGGQRAFAIDGRLDRVNPAHFAKVAEGEISGTVRASGNLGASRSVQGVVEIAKSRFAGLSLEGRADIAADANRLGRIDAAFTMGEARASASGAFGRAGDTLAVKFSSPDLAPLGRAFGLAVAGRVAGDALVEGTFASPSGRVALKATDLALPGELRVASLDAKLALGTADDAPFTGDVVVAGLREGKDKEALVTKGVLALRGTRAAHDLRVEADLPGNSRLRGLVAGGFVAAATALPEWRGRLEVFESTGRYPATLSAPATLSVAAKRFELGEARLAGEWGNIDLHATRWTPALFEAKGSARGVAVRTVTRLLALRQAPASNLVVGATWDLRAGETIEGFAELRRESGDVRVGERRQPLGLETLHLRLDAAGGRVKAKGDIRGAQVGRWEAEGEASLRRTQGMWEISPVASIAGRLDVDVPDLAWTAAWLGPDALVGGKLAGRVTLAGTARDPNWEGRIDGTNLAIRDPVSGFEGMEGTLALAFRDHEVRLEKLLFEAPWRPGTDAARAIGAAKRPDLGILSAEGAVNLATKKGEVRLKSTAYPVTQLSTRFLAVTGEARMELDGPVIMIAGDLKADAGWFGVPASAAPTVAEDVIVERGAPAEGATPSERIRLDLRVALGEHTHFTGRGLTTRLAGSIRLAGDLGAGLRASGSIRAVDGTYDAYGRKLVIERGALNFQGPIDNPGLNVLALRKGLAVEAGVEVLGNVSRPRVRLVSFPDVPESEKLAWLVLGRGQGQVSAGDAAILVSAAGSILGRDESQANRLLGGLGLGPDDIRLGQDSGSLLGTLPESTVAGKTGTNSTQDVLTVGKRLSDDIYLSYQQGLADAEGSMRVAWTVAKGFQLILRAGYQQGIDGVYRFTLDDAPVKLRK